MPIDGVSIRRLLRARPARVFEAWTRPDLMARWFFPGDGWTVLATADLEVGGRYEVAMRDPAGSRHDQFGEYREIVPHSRLVFTWNCPELGVTDSVVTVELVDRGDETELLLTHELPPDANIRRGHEEGWVGCLSNLEKLLNADSDKEEATTMSSIKDEIHIQAAPDKVYAALTTQAGYRGWWNAVAEVAEGVGSEAKLRFVKDGQPVNMTFRIDATAPGDNVRWTCVAHDMATWIGTTLDWRLAKTSAGTSVQFEHAGWQGDAPDMVAQGWKHFTGSLKAYVETGTGQPW